MSYGLEVRNSSGDLQISEEYPALQILASGTLSSWTYHHSQNWTATVPLTGITIPSDGILSIWIRPSSEPTGQLSSNSRIYWSNTANSNVIRAHQSTSTDYLIVGEPRYLDSIPGGNYGLEIYNSSEETIFTSNLPILQFTSLTSGTATSSSVDIQQKSTYSAIDYVCISQFFPTTILSGWNEDTLHEWNYPVTADNSNNFYSGIGAWFRKPTTGDYRITSKLTWMTDEGSAGSGPYSNTGKVYFFTGKSSN